TRTVSSRLSPIGFLGHFGRKSSETLGFRGKRRKRHAETTESSGKSGLGVSGRLHLRSVHLDSGLGHARPPATDMAVAREFTPRAGPFIMPMSRQLRAWMEAANS